MSLTGVKKNYLIIDTFLSLIGTLLWKVSRKTGIAKHGGTDLQHCSQFNPVSVRIFLMYSEVDRTLSTKKYTNMIIINQKMIILGRCGLPRPGTQKPSPTQSHNHAFSLMENEARWWLAPNLCGGVQEHFKFVCQEILGCATMGESVRLGVYDEVASIPVFRSCHERRSPCPSRLRG